MSDLALDIQEAIRKALPAHLSDQLQQVLKEGDAAKAALNMPIDQVKRRDAELSEIKVQLAKHAAITDRDVATSKREAEVTKREQKMELNEYIAKAAHERIAEMKELVKAVFQNNTLKYSRMVSGNSNAPCPSGSSMMHSNVSTTEMIDKEG